MKKSFFLLAVLVVIAGKLSATVRTVSNDPAGGAQYATLQAAYTAASNSDTLLLEGTNNPYEISIWAKQLVIIGIGFNPAKSNARRSMLAGTGGAIFYIDPAGSGSKFYGMEFTSNFIAVYSLASLINVSFADCRIDAQFHLNQVNVSNFIFTNCIFPNIGENFATPSAPDLYNNLLFTSCIFGGYIEAYNPVTNGLGSSLTIDHCIFLNTGPCLNDNQNSYIRNSIFMNSANPLNGTCSGNFFSNNEFRMVDYSVSPPPSPINLLPNTGSGNLYSDPNFVYYIPAGGYATTWNFHLQVGSPCINAGTGPSDIGPHGSITNFSESGEVLVNPIVRSLNINNITVVTNGTLNVQINATKPNDN